MDAVLLRHLGAFPAGSVRWLLAGGAVAGTWTHETSPKVTTLEVAPWRRLTKIERRAVEAEAEAVGAFLVPEVPDRARVTGPA